LVIPDKHRNQDPVPCLKMSEARRTLGVRIAPDGNNKAKARHLTEVAMEWGEYLGAE